jgi:hypothetical protein
MLRSNRNPDAWLYACDDGEQVVGRANDQVPNYLFGQNPYLREYADKYRIPLLGALGGAETMYPEFAAKLRDSGGAEAAAKAALVPSSGAPHSSRAVDPDLHDGEIHVLQVQGNVYMLAGPGGNTTVRRRQGRSWWILAPERFGQSDCGYPKSSGQAHPVLSRTPASIPITRAAM